VFGADGSPVTSSMLNQPNLSTEPSRC